MWRAATVGLLALATLGACSREVPAKWRQIADASSIEFIDVSFDELYPIYLTRQTMAQGPKAALWQQKYAGRYIRWTGKLVSFTANGITIKQKWTTVTFDISLFMDAPVREKLPGEFHLGDMVTYVGALDNYDDVFRTLYLIHGQLVGKAR